MFERGTEAKEEIDPKELQQDLDLTSYNTV